MGGQSSLTLGFMLVALAHPIAAQLFTQPQRVAGRTIDAAKRQLDAASNRLDNVFTATVAPVYGLPPVPIIAPAQAPQTPVGIRASVPTTPPTTPMMIHVV